MPRMTKERLRELRQYVLLGEALEEIEALWADRDAVREAFVRYLKDEYGYMRAGEGWELRMLRDSIFPTEAEYEAFAE